MRTAYLCDCGCGLTVVATLFKGFTLGKVRDDGQTGKLIACASSASSGLTTGGHTGCRKVGGCGCRSQQQHTATTLYLRSEHTPPHRLPPAKHTESETGREELWSPATGAPAEVDRRRGAQATVGILISQSEHKTYIVPLCGNQIVCQDGSITRS